MHISYAEEYQNNTVAQISGKISRMRKWLKSGVLFCPSMNAGYEARYDHAQDSIEIKVYIVISGSAYYMYIDEFMYVFVLSVTNIFFLNAKCLCQFI